MLWRVLKKVNSEYVDIPVDQKKLMYGAVAGLVRALEDPHSSFLEPSDNEQFQKDLRGNLEGIGAEIAVKNDILVVVAPLPNTPAARAGILAQDRILQINGEDTFDMSLEEAVSKIRGPKGTSVVLSILHKGADEAKDITIIRDAIFVESARSEIKQIGGSKVAVIKLIRFGPDTKSVFSRIVSEVQSQGAKYIILDLRNNPGGLLDAAIDVASFWLPQDLVVLKEVDKDKREFLYYSNGPGQLNGISTVVLTNEGSASASEIVAGALQDHKLATVVGEKTFGKGSVQDLIEFPDGSALKITIAKWLTPNGRSIHNEGLEPDVKVELTLEDYNADRDPQMERAEDLLGD